MSVLVGAGEGVGPEVNKFDQVSSEVIATRCQQGSGGPCRVRSKLNMSGG